jgi:hypothetical protein
MNTFIAPSGFLYILVKICTLLLALSVWWIVIQAPVV